MPCIDCNHLNFISRRGIWSFSIWPVLYILYPREVTKGVLAIMISFQKYISFFQFCQGFYLTFTANDKMYMERNVAFCTELKRLSTKKKFTSCIIQHTRSIVTQNQLCTRWEVTWIKNGLLIFTYKKFLSITILSFYVVSLSHIGL